MKNYTIEVDEEVYKFLQKNATPFEDTPNSVLRRLLLNNTESKPQNSTTPIPSNLPSALRQILTIIYYVRHDNLNRRKATDRLARELGVTKQTIIDKYTRQLGLIANEFDELLSNDLDKLRLILNHKFPNYQNKINDFFNSL